ncbi:hypothetical protein B7P43_G10813 [Cryptotermes secundus]|uniref:MADF domain-containing protein n=1 Tax=Cryptotermes secundus TaxID=105785 RepID=A0A2J7RRL9_9NEOP|nr:hypothetical protein B7P43_G10813 [Cryptotermes secundus]
MEWSEGDILGLIEAYRSFPVLWNPGEKDYYKKNKKVGCPEDDCKRKIISLLSSYRREKSREKKLIGTGKGKLFIVHI